MLNEVNIHHCILLKVFDIYEVEMTKEQREIYKNLAQKLMVEVDDILSPGSKNEGQSDLMTANHILTKLMRLTQITSGFIKYNKLLMMKEIDLVLVMVERVLKKE